MAQTTINPSNQSFFRLGAAMAIAGPILFVIFNSLHPQAPDGPTQFDDTRLLLQTVSQTSNWTAIHMGIVFSGLILIGGILAITKSLNGASRPWARLCHSATLFGGALAIAGVAIDGVVNRQLGDMWLSSATNKTAAVQDGIVANGISEALLAIGTSVLFGIGIFLLGVALLRSVNYSRAVGWLAIVGGLGGFVAGILQAFKGLTDMVLIFSLAAIGVASISIVWSGVVLWRATSAGRLSTKKT
jgi:hypothetical protein